MCTVIWGTGILADAVIRVVMARALPVGLVPGLNGALSPVTFAILQAITNVYRDGCPHGPGENLASARRLAGRA